MKKLVSLAQKVIATTAMLACASPVFAQWTLDADGSDVEFISIKNAAVAESHHFGGISGSVAANGEATVQISLDSVETLIPIRNERMREMLFETADFPTLEIETTVDASVLKAAQGGGVVVTELPLAVTMHGQQKTLTAGVILVGTAGDGLLVATASPILVNAADFGLDAGIGLLREVAGLKSISAAVPVTFQLLFAPVN